MELGTGNYWIDRYARQGRKTVACSSFDDKAFKVSNEWLSRFLPVYLGPYLMGKTVLELGCGWGRISKILGTFCIKVYGIDIVLWAVEEARRYYPEGVFTLYDGNEIPYPDGYFGGLVSWTVMQHIEPHRIFQAASEIGRVLQKGAYLAIYENVTRKPDSNYIWFRDAQFYFSLFKGFKAIEWELVQGADHNEEVHLLMVMRK
jgi:ubiquinone/menaquinone biosynthesis C-methylase UbiE